jgi:predicted RNase H-like nuclease (RuvC/YqgF family)
LDIPIIVGIDSGVTVGIAIIDTNLKLLAVFSKKNMSKDEILKFILKFGKPIIIATDVHNPPKIVKKLSSSLGSKLFYPHVSLTNYEKSKLVEEYEEYIKDVHQKDALAAAIRACKNYNSLFKNVKDNLRSRNLMDIYNDVVLRLFKSKSNNIKEIILEIENEKRKQEIQK